MLVLVNRILRIYPLVFVCFFGPLGYSFTPLLCIPVRNLIMRLMLATSYGNFKFRRLYFKRVLFKCVFHWHITSTQTIFLHTIYLNFVDANRYM